MLSGFSPVTPGWAPCEPPGRKRLSILFTGVALWHPADTRQILVKEPMCRLKDLPCSNGPRPILHSVRLLWGHHTQQESATQGSQGWDGDGFAGSRYPLSSEAGKMVGPKPGAAGGTWPPGGKSMILCYDPFPFCSGQSELSFCSLRP